METKMVKVGDKVRCIDDVFTEDSELPFKLSEITLPKKDCVYIVRAVDTGYLGGEGICLQEIKNKKFHFDRGGLREPIFSLRRFEVL